MTKTIETLEEAAREYALGEVDTCHMVDFKAGAEWMRKQFTLLGSDACTSCDDGRSTVYVTLGGKCIGCAQKGET